MDQSLFFVVFAALAVIIILAGVLARKRAEERRKELALVAQRFGLEYMPYGLGDGMTQGGFFERLFGLVTSPTDRFLAAFQGFTPFGQGYGFQVENMLVGRKDGADWFAFDYDYKEDTRDGDETRTSTYRNGIIAIRIPIMLPNMVLSPEGFMDRVLEKLGRHEIEFESAEFNKLYFVRCGDKQAAYDFFHPQMIEYFLTLPVRTWQMAGPFLVLAKSDYYEALEVFRVLNDVEGFVQRIPNYVKQDRGFQMPWANPFDNMS